MTKSLFYTVLLLLFGTPVLKAQLVFTPAPDAVTITSTLQGTGVTITNLTVGGDPSIPDAIALFSGGTTNTINPNISIASGVVITTGSATDVNNFLNAVKGPNNEPEAYEDGSTLTFSDNDLDIVNNLGTYNVKIITFTIVPNSNVLSGKLVFGSEEYPRYVGSQYNDASAIIIDGPGIISNGGYSDLDGDPATPSRNLTLFSNGGFLAINQINGGVAGNGEDGTAFNIDDTAFYIRNYPNTGDNLADGSGGANAATAFGNVQLNGFTTPLVFRVPVIAGATYKIKVVIGDVGDGTLDSGLFLDAFTSIPKDYGDLPSSFLNLSKDNVPDSGGIVLQQGASHIIVNAGSLYLGNTAPDSEFNGQPDANALGDTTDEGGITMTPLLPTSTSFTATIPYVNTTGGTANLAGWVDWNRDSTFDASEAVITTIPNGSDTTMLTFTAGLPVTDTGNYFMRFRVSTAAISSTGFGGELPDGEVEDYTIAMMSVPLPLTLISFQVENKGSEAELSWVTSSEQNTLQFIVQRSVNNIDWKDIISLQATGNSSITNSYIATDIDPAMGINYYRLKITDVDGNVRYSYVRPLLRDNNQGIVKLTPNPAHDKALLTFASPLQNTTTVKLVNSTGVVIQNIKLKAGATQYQVPVVSLPAGVYLLQIDGNGIKKRLKLLVQ